MSDTICDYCGFDTALLDQAEMAICGLQEVVTKGEWAAETNKGLIAAIKAHKEAVSSGLLGKHEQDAADRALWAVAGF